MRALLGQSVRVTDVADRNAHAPDRERTGTLLIRIHDAPIKLTSTVSLSAAGDGAVESFDGELKASVPLISGRVERRTRCRATR